MIAHRLAFVCALALTGAAVFWRGGRWERLSLAMLATDFVLTPIFQARSSWFDPQLKDFAIDAALLAGLFWTAHVSRTKGLMLLASLQALYVALYVPFWLFPHQLYRAFYLGGNALGYAQELILIGSCMLSPRADQAPDFKVSSAPAK